jgi:deazaflavin-dependent oxidoreductase (nitroreductase family)
MGMRLPHRTLFFLHLFSRGDTMENPLQHLASESFCYLTTIGRRTGRLHTIEIWFALNGTTLYLLSGGGEQADWVKNARKTPQVSIRIGSYVFSGHARDVSNSEEDALARRIIHAKYSSSEDDLDDWAATALPVAVDLLV